MRAFRRHYCLLLILLSALCVGAQTKPPVLRIPDVIYVPTDKPVIDEMLRLGGVSSQSVVYDLGCGDGRVLITAAERYGARGVGIDIDPERIRESNQNAAAAQVSDKVRFILGDLFELDVREATAMMLYLNPDLNVRLRPRLLSQLKPGTPVLSHDFDMGDWKPDLIKDVKAGLVHRVYLWIIPAQVAGVWQWSAAPTGTNDRYALLLTQRFQSVTGTLTVNGKESAVSNLKLSGDKLSFDTASGHYAGVVEGNRMSLQLTQNGREVSLNATRGQAGVGLAN